MEGRIWLINHNGSADLHTPIHPPPRVLPGLENYWANFQTFSRIQDSVSVGLV